MKRLMLTIGLAALAAWAPVAAQEVPPLLTDNPAVEEVVVVARRIGVPVWRISRGEATVILVGHIDRVPTGANWNPAELEKAVSLADEVVFPATARISAADVGRALFRSRSILFLPRGKLLTDYVTPELAARLERLHAQGTLDDSYLKSHPQSLALELRRSIGVRVRGGLDAVDVIEAAADRHDVKAQRISVVRADKLIDRFLKQDPSAYVGCLENAVAAVEAGPAGVRQRLQDWSRSRVQAVLRSPVERSIRSCGVGPPALGAQLRGQWRNALAVRLSRPGVTVGVVPLQFLAEQGGLLDGLEAQGLEISGPRWRD